MPKPTEQVDLELVCTEVRNMVRVAKQKGKLKHFTPKLIRAEVERNLGLEKDALLEYKLLLLDVIKNTSDEDLIIRTKPEVTNQILPTSEIVQSRSFSSAVECGSSTFKHKLGTSSKNIPAKTMESATRTDDEEEEQDGSSTFSVIKEPPRKREKQSRQLEQVKSTRQKKTPKTSESKEEHTIKKLKSYVTACGVRKVWVKEFKDTPQPQKQIARLKQILQELGMTGRPSMGQARKIKEQRELMQDLEEVSAFSRRIGAEKGPNGGAQRAYEIPDDTADDTGDVPQVNPKKTVFGSKRTITAFLDEQSD